MRPGHPTEDPLEQAVADWRAAGGADDPADRLSPAARARIASLGSIRESRLSPLGWLFFPATRFAIAGALPVALLSLSLGYLAWDEMHDPVAVPSTGASIEATIDGDNVVFVIANGSRVHRVYKSKNPNQFGDRPEFTTRDGSFEDRVNDGQALVFYRID